MLTAQKSFPQLSKALGLATPVYFKREDLHPYLSHKGRSIPKMIEKYIKQGTLNFVISSSGNAALASAMFICNYNQKHAKKLGLTIFIGEKIDKEKLKIIKAVIARSPDVKSGQRSNLTNNGIASLPAEARNDNFIAIKQVPNPKQSAFLMDKHGEAKNLRQSTDDSALAGYYDLAKELTQIKNLSAVFIPTSSGTTAQGLFEGFKKLKICPQIHIVQTDFCHPMVNWIASCPPSACASGAGRRASPPKAAPRNDKTSLALAIVDKVAHRKTAVLKIIQDTNGGTWVADNSQIKSAINLIKKTANIAVSANSALSVVGLQNALKQNYKFNGPVACLITGK